MLLPFLINLPLQNMLFLVKIDPCWPSSPQMRDGACFELGRSIAAGQQQHFSCFFGLLNNLEVWGFALTPRFPSAHLSRTLFAAGRKPGGEDVALGSARRDCRLPALSSTVLCCHEAEDRIIKLPFSQQNVTVSAPWRAWLWPVASCTWLAADGRCEKHRGGDRGGDWGGFVGVFVIPRKERHSRLREPEEEDAVEGSGVPPPVIPIS